MENNQNNCPARAAYEKICRAITPVRMDQGSKGSPAKTTAVSTPSSDPATKALSLRTKAVAYAENLTHQRSRAREATEDVPIEFHSLSDKTKPEKSTQMNVQEANPAKVGMTEPPAFVISVQDKDEEVQKEWKITAVEIADAQKGGTEAKLVQHVEDKFTDFISRTRLKIRTMSDAGDEKSASTKVGGNKDHFSDFIRKGKMKIRTTSSLKKRNESFIYEDI